MKIAFSDFDGTLLIPGSGVADETIAAIRTWRGAGNKFGIVTGRDHSLIRMETEVYGIPVDFLICANGASRHDGDGTVLGRTLLPHDAMEELFRSDHIQNYKEGMLFFTTKRAYSFRHREDAPASHLTRLSHLDDALALDDIVQMGLMFRDQEATVAAFRAIDADFPGIFAGNINRKFLDLNRKGVNKSTGIAELIRYKGWEKAELFVIGDDRNDLPMIEAYDGYTVASAKPFMHESACGVYTSVGAMLRDKI
ncbi:HAD-IIB family hydrolase [Selenomonas sp. F0473]|uniref:HAD-IIB family hydrolase n=1 Tax=Selenomonas sp. F0473 TaxID=999423 RepID=UPI00029E1038|nr:HAD-IIB family hydrolase [Selenomonas sp. F0473]EKU71723.1 HAD hydrolase, family IIB [Selenomonas sp. F0473]